MCEAYLQQECLPLLCQEVFEVLPLDTSWYGCNSSCCEAGISRGALQGQRCGQLTSEAKQHLMAQVLLELYCQVLTVWTQVALKIVCCVSNCSMCVAAGATFAFSHCPYRHICYTAVL